MSKTSMQQPDSSRWKIFLLVSLFGMTLQLELFTSGDSDSILPLTTILLLTPILGVLVGFIYWYVMSGLSQWIAKVLFKGQGSWKETRIAFAWAGIPYIAKLLLWIPLILLFGEDAFSDPILQVSQFGKDAFSDLSSTIDKSITLTVLFFMLKLLDIVLSITYYFTIMKRLALVHQFSQNKALGVFLLTILITLGLLWMFVPVIELLLNP